MKIDRHKLIQAFWKIPSRDRFTILLTIGIVAAICFGAVFRVIAVGSFNSLRVPDSTLTPFKDDQTYVNDRYDDLPIGVNFPGTSYLVFVGGEEQGISDAGCSFRYSDEVSLFVMEDEAGHSTKELIADNYSETMGYSSDGTYKQKVLQTGSTNAMEVEYQGGMYSSEETGKQCLITYRYEIGGGLSLIIGAATSDRYSVSDMKKILDRMLRTISLIPEKTEEQPLSLSENSGENVRQEQSISDEPQDPSLSTVGYPEDRETMSRDHADAVTDIENFGM